jgi:hypothetical protein
VCHQLKRKHTRETPDDASPAGDKLSSGEDSMPVVVDPITRKSSLTYEGHLHAPAGLPAKFIASLRLEENP